MSYLVVDPERELLVGIGHIGGIAEAVDCQATCKLSDTGTQIPGLDQTIHTDRWQENFDVSAGYQLLYGQNSSNVALQCRRGMGLTSG